jgi:hypothetical protein
MKACKVPTWQTALKKFLEPSHKGGLCGLRSLCVDFVGRVVFGKLLSSFRHEITDASFLAAIDTEAEQSSASQSVGASLIRFEQVFKRDEALDWEFIFSRFFRRCSPIPSLQACHFIRSSGVCSINCCNISELHTVRSNLIKVDFCMTVPVFHAAWDVVPRRHDQHLSRTKMSDFAKKYPIIGKKILLSLGNYWL